MKLDWYALNPDHSIREVTPKEVAVVFERDRVAAKTAIPSVHVSTVFLGFVRMGRFRSWLDDRRRRDRVAFENPLGTKLIAMNATKREADEYFAQVTDQWIEMLNRALRGQR